MWKWITGALVIALSVVWLSLDKHVRYLILNPPNNLNVLFWTQEQRDAGFQSIDKLPVVPKNNIKKGEDVRPLPKGNPLPLGPDFDALFTSQRIGAMLVLHQGKLRFERYGLDSDAHSKWTSFSVAKSFTSTLVGAALKDGYIKSLEDKVTDYVTSMKGSAYDQVTIRQLITMTSGVAWNEDYLDPNSDVSKFNFHQAEDGLDVTASYMRKLERDKPPGTFWRYSTGETNLIGLVVQKAVNKPLAEYLSETIWSSIGAESDASWVLGDTGSEIGGCCIQATTRDFLRFGQFILEGAKREGKQVVSEGWVESATTAHVATDSDSEWYGYQWWVNRDGSFEAKGIFGQGIIIDRERGLVIAINGNWPSALGDKEVADKHKLITLIREAIDSEQHITSANP